jgi:hypothetical protein
MKRNVVVLAAVVFVALSCICVFASDEMRAGKWEITSSMDMPGMPYKMPPTVISHCYTKEDVKDQKKVIANKNNDCTVTDMKKSGNKVTWKMQCTGKSKGTFSGETLFGKDFYESTINIQSEGRSMTTKSKAKRIGDCS